MANKDFTIKLEKIKPWKKTPNHLARTKTHEHRGNQDRRAARALERELAHEGPDMDM